MFGFGKKLKQLANSAKQLENKDALEGVVAAGLLQAASDGTISSDEVNKVIKLVTVNPALKAFDKAKITQLAKDYQVQLEADFRLGQMQMLKEIDDLKDDAVSAQIALLVAISVAEIEGKIDEVGNKVLNKIASHLGLSLSDFLE
jgi:tellurite resistance protein